MSHLRLIIPVAMLLALRMTLSADESPKPTSRTARVIEGWTVRIDDRLLQPPTDTWRIQVLKSLENRLSDIKAVVPADRVAKLQAFQIILDLSHGKLESMQYHPGSAWLEKNGYAADLLHCVHIPIAADLLAPRQINVQPWVILHELAHAYHDQVLGFDDPRILKAYAHYKESGHGDSTLLITGERVRHYGLTDHKEFFAEMTEAYFGSNDFFPFNRGELKSAEPEIYQMMGEIWDTPRPVPTAKAAKPVVSIGGR